MLERLFNIQPYYLRGIMKCFDRHSLLTQERIGFNEKRIRINKIRSMYLDAEDSTAELIKENHVSDVMTFKMDWDLRMIGNKMVDEKKVTVICQKIYYESCDE